mgnify:FL=1
MCFGHFRGDLLATLREVWEDQPVKEVMLAPFNPRLFQFIKAIRALIRRLGRTSGAAGTDFAMPLPPINALLARVFAGESRRLLEAIRSPGSPPAHHGVSLVAILRRELGTVAMRSRAAATPAVEG